MADTSKNKFLPFVTENSSPLHICTMLLSRTKGKKFIDIMTVFLAILKLGITPVKEYAASLPSMSKDELFSSLVEHYQQFRPDDSEIPFIQLVSSYFKNKYKNPLERINPDYVDDDMKFDEVIVFAFCLHRSGENISDMCEENIQKVFSENIGIFEHMKSYVSFDSEKFDETIEVCNEHDLEAFVLKIVIEGGSNKTYKATLVDEKSGEE